MQFVKIQIGVRLVVIPGLGYSCPTLDCLGTSLCSALDFSSLPVPTVGGSADGSNSWVPHGVSGLNSWLLLAQPEE